VERVVRHFQEELEALQGRLLEMGGLAEERVHAAVQSLVSRNIGDIDRVLHGDEPINELHVEIDNRCFKLLALHQPMATDLRAIVAGVKINTDLERVGDLAVNIAEAARRYATHPPVKKLIDIPQMGDIAQTMLRDSLDSFVIVTHNMQQAARVADMTAFFSISRGEEGQRWGELIEYDATEKIFTAPSDKRTEDYVTGRFG